MHFLFACGGTAGHINPAIAMAQMLETEYPGCRITFFGRQDGLEYRLVRQAGYSFVPIAVEGIRRKISFANVRAIYRTAAATAKITAMIRDLSPDLAIGTGGYVSYPLIAAAHRAGIPSLLHESNAVPGLSVRMSEKKATRVLLQFDACLDALRFPEKAETVGAPLRRGFRVPDRNAARRSLGVGEKDFLILSFGGSLGAEAVNEACLGCMRDYSAVTPGTRHIHACGDRCYDALKEKYPIRAPGTLLLSYIDDMPACMAAADLVICRAGAMTLAELAAMKKPAVLIPSPHVTGDHQRKNAAVFSRAGAAVTLEEGELTAARLTDTVKRLRSDRALLRRMGESAGTLHTADTGEKFLRVVRDLLSLPSSAIPAKK